jgi:hypothetical protein
MGVRTAEPRLTPLPVALDLCAGLVGLRGQS